MQVKGAGLRARPLRRKARRIVGPVNRLRRFPFGDRPAAPGEERDYEGGHYESASPAAAGPGDLNRPWTSVLSALCL